MNLLEQNTTQTNEEEPEKIQEVNSFPLNDRNSKRGKIVKVALPAIILVTLLALAAVLCFSFPNGIIIPKNKETTVFIATDLHLFSNNLVSENNQVYIKKNFTSDGRVQEYDYALVEALISEVNEKKPDFLILTGDLTFNGERDSHLELSRLLTEIESTKVLVIPGNHDMYSQGAVSALNDSTQPTENITAEDFRQIYANYGYTGAYSYDNTTLSYIYEIDDDKWALMLDTTLSRYNEENDYSITGGKLEASTLLWLEKHLAYAKANGISVISFTHHNLLSHNDRFVSNYTLQNSEQIVEIFDKYNVALNFSGHLHIQSIKQASAKNQTIYDICGGSLLDYGNRYGVLDIYENCYQYSSNRIDNLPTCESFDKYSFDVFCNEYYSKTLWNYFGKLGEENGEKAVRLLSEINAYYFDGNYKEIHRLSKKNKDLINLIKENTHNYDSSYVASIIEVEKDNQFSLLIKR